MRIMFASLMLLSLVAPAQAAEVRNYFAPERDGERVAACLSDGACGKAAADAFCREQGYDSSVLFQREQATVAARVIDSDKVCDGNCTAFKQVKCFTVRSDLKAGKTAL